MLKTSQKEDKEKIMIKELKRRMTVSLKRMTISTSTKKLL